MHEIVTRPRARPDLKDIWLSKGKRWNPAQSNPYLAKLDAGMAKLRTNPALGRQREDLRAGYRSLRVNEHLVYYLLAPPVIRIIRVLHARMDPQRHL
jgi:toxin ParE1/3/4